MTELLQHVRGYADVVLWSGALLLVPAAWILVRRARSDRRLIGPAAARIVLVASVLLVLVVTLMPTAAAGNGYWLANVNLVPGRGIYLQLTNANSTVGVYNIAGNIALFVLPGMLAPVALGWSRRRALFYAILMSLAVEVLQYVLQLGRASDVDDVLLNSLGAAMGLSLAAALGTRVSRRVATEAAE